MRGDGKNKEKKRNLNQRMKKRDVPLPKTLPADLKPYDTNNDGVLDAKERRIMELKKNLKERRTKTNKSQEEFKAKRRRQ
jgi:hypothetical protein